MALFTCDASAIFTCISPVEKMPKPQEKLATSLAALAVLQEDGCRIFQSRQFKRMDGERLIKYGFLRKVVRGWLISASPEVAPGDTTPWYTSFWEFCHRYCSERFSGEWHLSPQLSLDLHAEKNGHPLTGSHLQPQSTKQHDRVAAQHISLRTSDEGHATRRRSHDAGGP